MTPNDLERRETIENLINPKCVAVLGVTDTRSNWASKALRHCGDSGYNGRLYGVNPRGSLNRFEGFSIVSDLAEIEAPVDCALIGVGRDRVLTALSACAENGVRSAVVVGSGFGELGEKGKRLEAAMLEVARASGLRILGPNCIGLFRAGGGVCFTPFVLPTGSVGLISQSGNVAITLGLQAQRVGFGFSTCVGVGNQIDISFGEVLSWFADDPATTSVALYVEGVPSVGATEFIEGLRRCHLADKPVFILRGGATPEGSDAVSTHTGSLASDTRVWSALVEREHAIPVTSESALADALLAAQLPRFGRGVAVLTDGGGNSVMAMDSLSRHGLRMANLSVDTQGALRDLLPPLAPRHRGLNPLTMDTPGGLQDNPKLLATCAEICAQDPDVDAIVIGGLFGGFQDHRLEEIATAKRLAALRGSGLPIAVASAYSGIDEGSLSELRNAGVPVYGCLDRLAAAIACRYQPSDGAASSAHLTGRHDNPSDRAAREGRWLGTTEARRLLGSAGIPCPPVRIVRSRSELEGACGDIGFPLCLKIDIDEISHKSDVGGVKLGLASLAAVAAAADELWVRFPDEDLLVMPMFPPGFELLAGLSWDSTFGPVIVVGRGGIWTEVEDDIVVLPLALNDAEIADELSQLRCFPMLDGGRGQDRLDVDAIVDLVAALGNLGRDNGQPRVDLNPVIVYPDGLALADFRVRVPGGR